MNVVSMTDARTRAATAIATATGDLDPVPFVSAGPTPTDPPSVPTVLVASASIEPPSVACPSGRLYEVRVIAYTPITAPGAGDLDADALIGAVLDGLDADGLVWRDCVRGTFLESYPSYQLTVEVPS